MRRSSRFFGLDYIVQWRAPGWEEFKPVAALYDRGAAIQFAEESKAVNGLSSYRVVWYRNNEPTCLWRSDDRTEAENKLINDTIIS